MNTRPVYDPAAAQGEQPQTHILYDYQKKTTDQLIAERVGFGEQHARHLARCKQLVCQIDARLRREGKPGLREAVREEIKQIAFGLFFGFSLVIPYFFLPTHG